MSLIYSQPDYKAFKNLSLQKIKEAKILLNNKLYTGAYYLAGYSVEFALKACYCKTIQAQTFPPLRKVYEKLYNHGRDSLIGLMDVSSIKTKFEAETQNNNKLQVNWDIVKDWSTESRYASSVKKADAKALINAIEEKRTGVLTWIKKVW